MLDGRIVYVNCVDFYEKTAQAAFERSFISYLLERKDVDKQVYTVGEAPQDESIVSIPLDKSSLLSYFTWNILFLRSFFSSYSTRPRRRNTVVYFRASGLMFPARLVLWFLGYRIFYRTESLYDNLYDYNKVRSPLWKPLIYIYEWIDLRLSYKNIVVTEVLVKKLCDRYGLKERHVICIPNPLTLEINSIEDTGKKEVLSDTAKETRFHLGYFGSLKEHQRIQDVIAAVDLLKGKLDLELIGFKFLIFGGGPYEQELKQEVEGLGLSQFVDFKGGFDHANLAGLYESVDYLIAPYSKHWNEKKGSSALKIWEYLFFNKPIIVPNILDYKFVGEMGFGALYELENVASLGEVLEKFIIERPTIQGNAARKFVVENRSKQAIFSKYLNVMLSGFNQ